MKPLQEMCGCCVCQILLIALLRKVFPKHASAETHVVSKIANPSATAKGGRFLVLVVVVVAVVVVVPYR